MFAGVFNLPRQTDGFSTAADFTVECGTVKTNVGTGFNIIFIVSFPNHQVLNVISSVFTKVNVAETPCMSD